MPRCTMASLTSARNGVSPSVMTFTYTAHATTQTRPLQLANLNLPLPLHFAVVHTLHPTVGTKDSWMGRNRNGRPLYRSRSSSSYPSNSYAGSSARRTSASVHTGSSSNLGPVRALATLITATCRKTQPIGVVAVFSMTAPPLSPPATAHNYLETPLLALPVVHWSESNLSDLAVQREATAAAVALQRRRRLPTVVLHHARPCEASLTKRACSTSHQRT